MAVGKEKRQSGTPASYSSPLLSLVLLACLLIAPQQAHGQEVCDNKIEIEKGEGPGPFFGLEYALAAYALAEKVCGAPAISMSSKILEFVEKEGCGPDTPIYSELQDRINRLEAADLKTLAQDGRTDIDMSSAQVRQWAEATVEEFGGCPVLLNFHEQVQSGNLLGR